MRFIRYRAMLFSLFLSISFCLSAAYASTADHSQFEELQKSFSSGPEVTAACLECHTEASSQIHETLHWTWLESLPDGQDLGKQTVVNNFCIGIGTNEPRCTSCHIGYGYTQKDFDFDDETAVDCLVCHDTSGVYKKFPTDAGHPNYVPKEWPKNSGKIRQPIDLATAAQSVGDPAVENCGSCHFYGGGGDSVKHGDMDSTLLNPSFSLDVHLSDDGAGLACQDCHTTDSHQTDGSRYGMTAYDANGIDVPGHIDDGRASCASCHGNEPHEGDMAARLNKHTETLACQSCHIPSFAREKATKMWWDWSVAGRKTEEGKPFTTKNEAGEVTYTTLKGEFVWEQDVVPEYAWFNGNIDYTVVGEKVDASADVLALTMLQGQVGDPNSRIWPFKVMRSKQPIDPVNEVMIIPHLFGKDANAYWKNFDWTKSAEAGMEYAGIDFSGEVEFIETTYHWPITHMVAPAEDAVACSSCHSADSRLAAITDIYIPGRDNDRALDKFGWALIWLSIAGVVIHAIGRFIAASKRS